MCRGHTRHGVGALESTLGSGCHSPNRDGSVVRCLLIIITHSVEVRKQECPRAKWLQILDPKICVMVDRHNNNNKNQELSFK